MKSRPDHRRAAVLIAVVAVAVGGLAVDWWTSTRDGQRGRIDVPANATDVGSDAHRAHQSFQQAVAMLHARQFEYAIVALQDVLAVYPRLPEAHANMGYAFLGLEDHAAAARFFESATDIRPSLHTAYFGLGLARAGQGDFGRALAAMQTFAHLADGDDPFLSQAESVMSVWRRELDGTAP